MNSDRITSAHGSGGQATGELIRKVFARYFDNEYLAQMEDASIVPGTKEIAMTTDSFVVRPLKFPGGDIGRLAVCGTVNDLASMGAVPKYLTAGFILEEGLEISLLTEIVKSMAETAKEAGVYIVAGDTKVVEGNGGMFINTAGVGLYSSETEETQPENSEKEGEIGEIQPEHLKKKTENGENQPKIMDGKKVPASVHIKEGDAVLVTGTIGDHHAAILSARLGMEAAAVSDVAPLCGITKSLMDAEDIDVHAMRDITRGGLATVLAEMAETSRLLIEIEEVLLPVKKSLASFAGLMGLDPLYMGNEGKMVIILPESQAKRALEIIRNCRYGEEAVMIGKVGKDELGVGQLVLKTKIGGRRLLNVLSGEGLPRIC